MGWENFKKSFLFNWRDFITYIIDIGYFVLLFILTYVWLLIALKVAHNFTIDIATIFELQQPSIESNIDLAWHLLIKIFGSLFFFFLFSLFVYSFLVLFKWRFLQKKRIGLKNFKQFYLMNFFWFSPLFILFLYVVIQHQSLGFFLLLYPFFMHFHTVMKLHFNGKALETIKFAFKEGMKVKKFLVPYLFIFFISTVVFFIISSIPVWWGEKIGFPLFVVLITWVRKYYILEFA